MLDEDALNAPCYVMLFGDPTLRPLLLKENTLLAPSETLEEPNILEAHPRLPVPLCVEQAEPKSETLPVTECDVQPPNEDTCMLDGGYLSDGCLPAIQELKRRVVLKLNPEV